MFDSPACGAVGGGLWVCVGGGDIVFVYVACWVAVLRCCLAIASRLMLHDSRFIVMVAGGCEGGAILDWGLLPFGASRDE